MNKWIITSEERMHLRELAKKQLQYSKLPIMKEREEQWYKHNDLKGEIPMIHFETWTCEKDLLPPLKCTSEAARNIELQLNRDILNHEVIDDDRVVPSCFNIGWKINMVLFDLNIKRDHATDSKGGNLGFHINSPIKDLHEDMHLLKQTKYSVDKEGTLSWKAFVEEVLGDILPVKISMGSLNCSLTQNIINLMGMETMMF